MNIFSRMITAYREFRLSKQDAAAIEVAGKQLVHDCNSSLWRGIVLGLEESQMSLALPDTGATVTAVLTISHDAPEAGTSEEPKEIEEPAPKEIEEPVSQLSAEEKKARVAGRVAWYMDNYTDAELASECHARDVRGVGKLRKRQKATAVAENDVE